ncbi:heat-inducible transcriptional repressor HrcA [Aminobacterium colombiense]|uniref:heat-inducible transcriptional repressor HrcA n=1 Tax=Aminobacterium colombiense TaxID=81468 RepID=UPI003321B184
MLIERQLEIVLAVVYEYIQTGEPAGSRTIARKYLRGCSAATVRNEMYDLEQMGYFYQPHTSAGRLPTSRAYRLYVDSILHRRRVPPIGFEHWRNGISDQKQGIESLLSYASQLLGRVTNYVGVAAISSLHEVEIQRVDFLCLGGNAVLVILILEGGLVHHNTVTLPCELSQDSLDELARRINMVAVGHPWSEVREVLYSYVLEGLEKLSSACRAAILQMDALLQKYNYKLFTGGAQHILSLPDFQDVSKLQAVISLLEEESSLVEMVGRCSVGGEVCVTIGDENPEVGMQNCSVLMVPSRKRGRKTVLGIIGPMRMDYEKTIAVLEAMMADIEEDDTNS